MVVASGRPVVCRISGGSTTESSTDSLTTVTVALSLVLLQQKSKNEKLPLKI